MAIRTCLNCNIKFIKGVSGFDIFPRDDFKWCSDKCLFLWLLKHKVRVDKQIVTGIQRRRDKAILKIENCLTTQDIKQALSQEEIKEILALF